jgi:hypothetical protein
MVILVEIVRNLANMMIIRSKREEDDVKNGLITMKTRSKGRPNMQHYFSPHGISIDSLKLKVGVLYHDL